MTMENERTKAPERKDPKGYDAVRRLHDAVAAAMKEHVSEHVVKYPWSDDPMKQAKDARDLERRFLAGKVPARLLLQPNFETGEVRVLARLPKDAMRAAAFKLANAGQADPKINFTLSFVPGYERIGLDELAWALDQKTLLELLGPDHEPVLGARVLERLKKKANPFLSAVGRSVDHANLDSEPDYVSVPNGDNEVVLVTRRYYDTKKLKERKHDSESVSVAFTAFEDADGKLHEASEPGGHEAVTANFLNEVRSAKASPKDLLKLRTHFVGAHHHLIEVYSKEGMGIASVLENTLEHLFPTHEVTIEKKF